MLTTNRLRPRTQAWKLFNEMHDEFSRELSDWFASATSAVGGSLGIWTKEGEAIVAVELPGRESQDIDVSVHRNVVTIEAKSAVDELPEVTNFLRRERPQGDFRRQVQLPFELDSEKVDATYERGLLVVRLSAHASAQPARIEVKAG